MNLDTTNEVLGLVSIIVALAVTGLGLWVKYGLPRWKESAEANAALLGRPEVKDRAGAVESPAQPGMAAQIYALTQKVEELVDIHRFQALEEKVNAQAALTAEHGEWIAAHDQRGDAA
jgi:hypothetical protein